MDEQRAWLKSRRKRRLRILAAMLSICVLFTTYPDILATLFVFASEEPEQSEVRYISGFTALSDEVREQTVPVGTRLDALLLPDMLEAAVTEEKQPSEDMEEGNHADAGEKTWDGQDMQPDDGESGKTDEATVTEKGDEAETEKEENTGESVPLEEQGESGSGQENASSEETQENASSEETQENAASQETHTVTMQEYHAENVISVQTVERTQTEAQEESEKTGQKETEAEEQRESQTTEQKETVAIDGVSWQSEPEYDGNTVGTYLFTAVLPEGYALAEGVSLPEITVTVQAELTEETEAFTAAGELFQELLSDYFDGLSADEIYDAVLAMDVDTCLSMIANYEELLAAMTDEDMTDEEMQAVTDEIGRGIADVLECVPVEMPVLFIARNAASEASAGVPMTRLSGSGTAFVYHNFVETTSFAAGVEYAFLNGIYGYENAVASLGSGAILKANDKKNNSYRYIKGRYGNDAEVKIYVDVVTRGRDFDGCRIGGLYQVPDSGTPTEYRYFCAYSGAQNCGPLYAYTYDTAELTYENVSASLKSLGKQGSSRSEDYIVTLTFDEKTVTLDEGSYKVKVTDPDSDAVTIVVSDSDGNQITTNFRAPLVVSYEGNGSGVTGLPDLQKAESGKSVTLSSAVPARSGYTFVNWIDGKTGNIYNKGQNISSFGTKSLWLLAQWKDVQKPDFTYEKTEALAGTSKSDIEEAVKEALTITDNEPVSDCTVTVTMADDISKTVGDKSVTVTVRDKAGNQTTKQVPVTIIALSLELGMPVFTEGTKKLSAKLLSPGGDSITETGFVWGIMTSPTLTINNGRQKTAFPVTELNADISVTAAGIQKGVTYYARAYAICGGITYYSNEITFGLGVPAYGSFTIANNGSNTFTVTRTGGSEGAQTVYYRTVNGSAVGGTHFTHQASTLTFAEGETSKTITIAEQGANTAYSGKPATAWSNADRTYSVELYRVAGGGTLGSTTTAARIMTAGADYKVNRSLYTDEKSEVNVAGTSTTNGRKIADTTAKQGGATDNVSFLTNRDNTQNYHTNSTFGTYYSNAREREYLEKTASGWYYRYDLLAYEYEDGYEHAYMGTKALEDKHYGLSSDSTAVSGVDGQLWACNFLQGQKEDAKHYYFPDTRTGGGESAGYPLDVRGSTTGYNGKTYVDLKLNETCYVYFGSTGKDTDIWYVDGLTSYAIVHDEKEPQLVAVAPMAGGLYKAGDSFTVSLIFDEIVDSANSSLSNVKVKTNWGEASYAGGADTNVLYFTGTVKVDANGDLSVTELTNPGNIKDMCNAAGTVCTSKGGATTASVDAAQPNLTAVSKGVSGGTGTVNVKVNTDQAKTNALRYAWSDSASMPATGWVDATSAELASAKTTSGLSLSIRKEAGSGKSNGIWYLHVIGTYNTTGATTYKCVEVNFGTKSSPVSPAPAAPTLTASADNSNWATSRSISVATTNAAGGTLQYRRAGTSAWITLSLDSAGKVTTNVTENGYYTFRLTVGEYILTRDVLVEKIDRQNPTATVGTPVESGTNRTAKAGVYTKITLPITFSDSGSGVKTVQYAWTGTSSTPTSWQTLSLTAAQKQSGTAEIPYTASENGETNKYLHIKVTDNVGKTVTAVSVVYTMISQTAVDNHAPKITLTGAPTAWTNDTATLEWKLTDYSGKNYEVILPDGRKARANAAQGEVWARQNGSYTVKVRDLDYGGENTATISVTYIDTTAPSVTVSKVSDGWQTTAQSVTISASDSQSGVGKKYYKIVTNDQETPGEGLTEFTSSSVSVGENGVWYVYYKIYDQTGDDTVGREANGTEGFVGPIRIDAKTPTLTADAPDKGVSETAGLEVALKAVYGTSGGTVKVGNSTISALGAPANDPGSSNDITRDATYKINAKGTYRFVLTSGSGKTIEKSLTVYEASFDLQGGTGTAPTQLVVKDGLLTQPTAPTKAGSVFQGWYTAAAGGEEWDFATGTVTSDCTLYARWKTNAYTVTFHKNGGMIENESSFTSYTYGTALTLPAPTRTGYTFGGWYENEGCTGTAVTNISGTDTGNKEYWAKWTAKTYQVTFHYHGANGGNTIASQNVTYDSKYGSLPVPSRTGYTFKGWYTEENGQGSQVDAGTTVTTASAHTLHAFWKDETAPDQPVLQDGTILPAGWTNTQTTIPLKTYDGVDVTRLLVSVDGSSYVEVSGFSGGTGSVNYSYTVVQEGEHTYQFKAVDAAGNTSAESGIFTVKLDQTKPEIGTLTYENEAHLNFWHWIIGKTSMIIHVPVADTGSGVTEISFCLTPRDAAGNPDSSSAVTKTATVTDGEAKITFDKDFRGTIAISCTDAAGNAADGVTVGKDAGGVIVEDQVPVITIQADRNLSDTQQTQPGGVDVAKEYYNSAPALFVTVKDDTGNAIAAGIATVTYQVEKGEVKSVPVNTGLQAQLSFTIPASEIPTGSTEITIKTTDNAGNPSEEIITIKVKGPEKQPAAEIDYRQEELTKLVPGEKYSIDGTEYTADQEGCIQIDGNWFGTTVSIVRKGNGNETTDSPVQSLPIPARPAAPNAPELSARDDKSITLKTITGAQYRLTDREQNWQDSTRFEGLKSGTIYSFTARYPATDTSFASVESSPARIATVPAAPTKDKLEISYTAETITLTDGIEAFTDLSCTTPVAAGSAEAYMGQTVYIRYPANGIIPESPATSVPIPARPTEPTPGIEDASYPKAADGAITGLTAGTAYEYRVKDQNGDSGTWQDASLNGTRIENLPAGEYEVRVKAVETGNVSFRSEAADVTIGEKPATKYETPDIRIDYTSETLTGFAPGAEYIINGKTVTAAADGVIKIEEDRFETTLSIVRKGNGKDKLDSDAQSLPVPARPQKPTPAGVDVSTAGGTGKLTGLTAGVTYEVSADGGKTWVSHTADRDDQITGLAPGAYVVRVKAGTSNFVSGNSDPVTIGAYRIKVIFMVDGAKYKEIAVDYGAALTDIPPVPTKENAVGAWCMDEQGATPAAFTNITADMTVYAVYTTTYTITLQSGTGYILSAQTGSTNPVKEGGSFTFRFALENGYQRTGSFAVKVNGAKVELTADGTYTISDVRENKTVTVEGVAEQSGGKPSNPDGGNKEEEPEPTPPPSESSDDTPSTPPVNPPAKVTPPAPETTPRAAEKEPEGRKPETTPKQEESREEEEREPEGTGAQEPETDSMDAVQTEKEPQPGKREVKIGDGTVIVTVVCEDERCTATVAGTEKVVTAVLTPDQQELVNGGETIEIRIDVTDISDQVPKQDREIIEGGIEAYREEVPGLVLGMYVDISMFIRIGAGDWNAITETKEPIEVVVGIPEELQGGGREFYIIRAHNGEYTFMNDLDDVQETITVSTALFSSYAIAYVETDETGADNGAKCGLCHICPTFLGLCCFVWLAIIILIMIVMIILLRKKKEEQEAQDTGQ